MKREVLLTACVCVLSVMLALPAFAEKEPVDPDRKVDSDLSRVHGKLKRGLTNVLTFPLEVPKQTKGVVAEGKNVPHKLLLVVPGVFKGVGYGLVRAGSGLWDTFTFNINYPKDSQPFLKPDYVWQDMDSE